MTNVCYHEHMEKVTKKALDEFMNQYFLERTATLRRQIETHLTYWRRFFYSECRYDSRRGCVGRSEAEKILDVTFSGDGAEVVTSGYGICRSRFRLKMSNDRWLIQEVDTEYPQSGWGSWKDRINRLRELEDGADADGGIKLNLKESSGCVTPHNPCIDQFMIDYFRERTDSRKRELEIYAPLASRFYGPECEWTRWVPSVKASAAERVLNVLPANAGTYVITHGHLGGLERRYELRPARQGLLIWEVNLECPLCHRQGRQANCFWCRGTLWEHAEFKKRHEGDKLPGEETPPQSIEGAEQ